MVLDEILSNEVTMKSWLEKTAILPDGVLVPVAKAAEVEVVETFVEELDVLELVVELDVLELVVELDELDEVVGEPHDRPKSRFSC